MAIEAPKWPDGDPGKVLLYIDAECSVDALFECFFGSFPSFQVRRMHLEGQTPCYAISGISGIRQSQMLLADICSNAAGDSAKLHPLTLLLTTGKAP